MYEESFIGNCLTIESLIDSSKLLPKHFSNIAYRKIWECILSGKRNALEISEAIGYTNELSIAIGEAQVSTHGMIENEILKSYNVDMFNIEYAKALKKVEAGVNPAEAIAEFAVEESESNEAYSLIGNTAIEVYNDMQARIDGDGSSRFIHTGLKALDDMIGGLERGNLTVIAARASQGKTSIAMDFAIHMALTEQVCFNSIEMDKLSIGYRVTSTLSNLNLMSLRTHTEFPADVWRKAASATMSMNDLKLNVNDNSSMTVPKIISEARKHKKKYGLGVLLIDYLGLIISTSNDKKRNQEIAEMTRALKGAAKELDCAVILLSQLNREADGCKPTIANLSDSSAVENDADLILFPYRPNKGVGLIEDALLIVGKNRNGPIGDIPIKFLSKCASFKDNDYGNI